LNGKPFPEQILPEGSPSDGNLPVVTGGSDLGALDYRADPSLGGRPVHQPVSVEREDPTAGGEPVGPQPDRTIKSYDLPDELGRYDRMGRE
jgi:hypothetical protein